MVAGTGVRCERSSARWWRAAMAVGLAAAGLAGASDASAATMVTHSATSGTYENGRLVLYGVSGRVTYVVSGGRSGTVSVGRLHRRLFLPGAPATGTLHVDGMHGGDEPTFKLTKPRYSAARRTVSYKAKPLDGKARASRAARVPVPRTFGAASLSILGHPRLGGGDYDGNVCSMEFTNVTDGIDHANRGNPVQLVSSDQWDTSTWVSPPDSGLIGTEAEAGFFSQGGTWRGCGASAVWGFVQQCNQPGGCGPTGTFTFNVEWDWGSNSPRYSCVSSNPAFKCEDVSSRYPGIHWWLLPA